MHTILDLDDVLSRLGGNRSLCHTIMQEFLNKHRQDDAEIVRLVSEQTWSDARAKAHTLKGISLNIGADELSQAAAELEKNLKQDTPDHGQLSVQLQKLTDCFQRAVTAIEQATEELSEPRVSSDLLTSEEVSQGIIKARDCFDMDYAGAMKTIEQLTEQTSEENYPELHQLLNMMRTFDILKAREELHRLAGQA